MKDSNSPQKDEYIREHFLFVGKDSLNISFKDQKRIDLTLNLVPYDWVSILDVGCGDGRVSRELVLSGKFVVGLDWSNSSIKKFIGHPVVCDLRVNWPIKEKFDGAICAEVIEHLKVEDVDRILTNIRRNVRKGFIITVPANEELQILTTKCARCAKEFHLYGHLTSFSSFDEVDALVGQKSKQRIFIKPKLFSIFGPGSFKSLGYIPSVFIDRLRRLANYYPYVDNSICPYCGTRLPEPPKLNFWNRTYLRSLKFIEIITSGLRRKRGWFCCLYESLASNISSSADVITHHPHAHS